MKKKLTLLTLGLSSAVFFNSCQKEQSSSVEPKLNGLAITNTNSNIVLASSGYVYSNSGNYAQYVDNSGYGVYNDAWGTGTDNTQTLNVWSTTHWNVVTNQPSGGNPVKTYPHSAKQVNKAIGSLNTCSSGFNYSVPGSWAGDIAYDAWAGSNDKYEIMIWMGHTNGFNPLADNYGTSGAATPSYSNVSVGGHTFNVYHKYWSKTGKYVFSFVRTSNTGSGTVDIKAVLNWLRNTPKWLGNETLNRIEFGFEIGTGSGTWTMNSFSVNVN